MPRKKRIRIDVQDPVTLVGMTLPDPVVDTIDLIVRRTLSTRAAWMRTAVIDRLTAEGYVDPCDIDDAVPA